MNKARRAELKTALEKLSEVVSLLEQVRDEEQDAFDNLSESLQQGDKGEKMQTAVANLEEAISLAESCVTEIESASE